MLLKNVASQGVYLYAYTIATGAAKTGDAANITGYSSIDGATTGTVFATTNPTEISATNVPGVYWQPLAQSETNGNAIAYAWKSATSGVAVDPLLVLTSGVNMPTVAPGAASGMFVAGTNAATVITTSLTTHLIGTVDTVTTLTNLPAVTTDWLSAAGVSAAAVTKIQSGLATPTNITAGTITTTTNLTNAPTAGDFTTAMKSSITAAVPTAAQNATAHWQDTTAGDFTVANSIGKSLFTGIAPGTSLGLPIIGRDPFPASGTIVSRTWDEILTSGTHNVSLSTGKLLRLINPNSDAIYSGTCPSQAGMTGVQIKLDSGASAVSGIYNYDVISITGGTDVGDSRIVTDYDGASRIATVDRAVTVQPDATSTFDITPTASSRIVSYIAGQDPASLVWAAQTRTLTAGTNIVLAKGTGVTGFSDITAAAVDTQLSGTHGSGTWGGGGGSGLDAAGVRSAIGMASANLDTQISGLSTYAGGDTSGTTMLLSRLTSGRATGLDFLDASISSRLATSGYTAPPSAAAVATAVLTTAMTESYNADGAAPTLTQAMMVTMQRITEFAISSTSITVKKLDGSTTAYTLTMDSATAPTNSTRSS